MIYLLNRVISNLKLARFYKNVFPAKRLIKEFPNIVFRDTSFPIAISLLISDRCNFSCTMCSWKGSEPIQSYDKKESLNKNDFKNFLFQIKNHYPLIHIGGGEPLMHRDLLEIITIIKNNKLKCLMTTNGFLMNEGIIDKLVKLKIDVLIFSLYGLEETHDCITGVKGSFNKSVGNLKYILKKRTKYTKIFVSTLPLPKNISELKQVVKNLYILGVDGIKIEQLNFLTPKEYEHSVNNEDFNLKPHTFLRDNFDQKFITDLISIYEDIRKTFRNFVYFKPYLNKTQLINWYGAVPYWFSKCFFIAHSVFINYNGDIIPCQFFKDCILGNIKEDSLESVWQSLEYKTLRKNINLINPITCRRCCKN